MFGESLKTTNIQGYNLHKGPSLVGDVALSTLSEEEEREREGEALVAALILSERGV